MKYLGKELNETLESERGSAILELVVPAHGAALCVPLTWTPQLSAQHLETQQHDSHSEFQASPEFRMRELGSKKKIRFVFLKSEIIL